MRKTVEVHWLLALAMALGAAGCLPSVDNIDTGPLTDTFAVTDYYTPSGFMGDGANFRHLYADVGQNCAPRPANARGNCVTFTYFKDTSPNAPGWAGAFWVFPANNWGSRPGHAIDTTKFHSIHYFASIEYPPESPADVAAGIVPDNPNVVYGITSTNGFQNYDTVNGKIFPPMSGEMKEYWIPFPDLNPVMVNDSLIGAFGWSIAFPSFADPKDPLVIHFDDIVWDTAEPPASVTQ
jgi:hypothetical protein